jgi:phosphomannomutase
MGLMNHRLDPSILREYDVRGRVGPALGEADARAVGRSFATRVRRAGGARVAVGRDGRLSSPMLEAALVEGLVAGGVDVSRIGLGPSPMLYFAERHLAVDGGIHVTASHNPGHDNGFKLVLGHRPFFGEDIQDLARIATAGDWTEGAGAVEEADVLAPYVARLLAGHDGGAYRIGWDCGSGAAGPVIEALTRLLPGEHHLLHTAVDGRFPHHHPDPTVEANLADLKALVSREGLDLGFAFDGDGDRIGAVDGAGRVLWGDQILAILAEPVLAAAPGAPIVADVKASRHLFDRVAALGGRPVMAPTGHSAIKTRMRDEGAPIAGELSGHVFFAELGGHDDAAYAAVRLISALHGSGRTLTAWRDAMPDLVATPDLRVVVPAARKTAVVEEVIARLAEAGATVDRTDGARVTTEAGWWLLRASNTESVLTVRAEAASQAALDHLLEAVRAQLAPSGVRLD